MDGQVLISCFCPDARITYQRYPDWTTGRLYQLGVAPSGRISLRIPIHSGVAWRGWINPRSIKWRRTLSGQRPSLLRTNFQAAPL